ncbi:hypothetical protein F751_1213 [Auxenochlorella protothecoides]|uniref:Uncharacterized protein n=1 Tax=Auxenochlorella protothecoides TaxID=3075 RepID=A0A087SNY2_AUXPR|nr:hypothetical protein F751_1213 [Auxenochlorella protothecoides]KFM27436.1 hypothetical protein F751_1213 [Auxenochlorella protothecoides]
MPSSKHVEGSSDSLGPGEKKHRSGVKKLMSKLGLSKSKGVTPSASEEVFAKEASHPTTDSQAFSHGATTSDIKTILTSSAESGSAGHPPSDPAPMSSPQGPFPAPSPRAVPAVHRLAVTGLESEGPPAPLMGPRPPSPDPDYVRQVREAVGAPRAAAELTPAELEEGIARLPAGPFATQQEASVRQPGEAQAYRLSRDAPELAAGPFAAQQDLSLFSAVDGDHAVGEGAEGGLEADVAHAPRHCISLDRRTESQAVIVEELQAGKPKDDVSAGTHMYSQLPQEEGGSTAPAPETLLAGGRAASDTFYTSGVQELAPAGGASGADAGGAGGAGVGELKPVEGSGAACIVGAAGAVALPAQEIPRPRLREEEIAGPTQYTQVVMPPAGSPPLREESAVTEPLLADNTPPGAAAVLPCSGPPPPGEDTIRGDPGPAGEGLAALEVGAAAASVEGPAAVAAFLAASPRVAEEGQDGFGPATVIHPDEQRQGAMPEAWDNDDISAFAGSEQGTQSSTGIMSTGKDTASPPAPLTLPTLPTGAGSLGNDGSLTGQQAGGVPWDVQARDFFDGGVHWARGHPYHAGAGLLLLYPAWLIAAASLRTVLTEFTPVLVMSALVALAATALSWFVLAGELPPLSAFIPSGPAPPKESNDSMIDKNDGPLTPNSSQAQPSLVESALGEAGPGKEQAGNVIVETDEGGEVEIKGPSTLERAKDVASNLASSAAAAVTQAGQSAMAAVQNLTDSSPADAASEPTQGGTSVVDAITNARDQAVINLKQNAQATARGEEEGSGYAPDSDGPGPVIEGVHHVQ